jgi:putative transposase
LTPSRKRELACDLIDSYRASERQVCQAMQLSRTVYRYQSIAADSSALQMRIKEITQTRVHYGYRRVHVLLKRESFQDNHKRVYRLRRPQSLSLRHKRPRRSKAAQLRQPHMQAQRANQMWSMDFVANNLFDGRKLRMLTVLDCYTRERLAIHVGQSLKGEDARQVLKAIVGARGKPATIKTDNGSEFVGKVINKWAYEHGIAMDLSRPGKLTANAMVESFNGRLRQECLNQHWFLSLGNAKDKIEAWRRDYNELRPHK